MGIKSCFALLLLADILQRIQSEDCVETDSAGLLQFSASKTLPEICAKWGMTTASDCIDKCYNDEAASDIANADREMAWGIVGSVTGGAGDVFDSMPSKKAKKDNDLLQFEASKAVEKKFIGMAIAGVGILAGSLEAISDRDSAVASANSQNCEQLGSLITQHGLASLGDKVAEVGTKVDQSLEKLDLVRQDIVAVKDLVGQVEERLTAQLGTLSSGQNSLLIRVDEVLQRIEKLNLLNRGNALNTKMTEYYRCAGNIDHAFDTIQGAISDRATHTYDFKRVLQGVSSASEWSRRYDTWKANLIPLLQTTAMTALEGMNCMSVLVSTGGLLKSYYVELAQDLLRQNIKDKLNGYDVVDNFYQISTDIAARIFQQDEVLTISLNAISQLRYVLMSIPREGYWEDFSVYTHNLNAGYNNARGYMQTENYMALMRDGLADAAPVLFPPSPECLAELGRAFPDISSLTLWKKSGSIETVVAGIEKMISINEQDPVMVHKGTWFQCSCPSTQCSVQKKTSSSAGTSANFGFSGAELNERERRDNANIARYTLRKLIDGRKDKMKAWNCRALDVGARSDAVAEFKTCLGAGTGSAVDIGCDFEAGLCGWTTPAGILPWTSRAGSTTSGGTGPSSAAQGTHYVYTEVSQPNFPHKVFSLDSPLLQAAGPFSLSFSYHMLGSTIGSLAVEALDTDGTTWTKIWEKTGAQGDSWHQASVAVPGSTKQIRLKGVSGTDYTGDIAIDDIKTSSTSTSGSAMSCLKASVVACPLSTCRTWLPQCQ